MKLIALLSLFALVCCTGCNAYWYRSAEKFTVQESNMNWVQIYYQASESSPRMRCDMRNNGQIILLEGNSVTVGDDFNIDYKAANFGDVRKYHYTMPPEMYTDTLQALVNVGLLEHKTPEEGDPVYPKVMILANIDHTVMKRFTTNPELIAEIRSLLFRFKMAGQVQ